MVGILSHKYICCPGNHLEFKQSSSHPAMWRISIGAEWRFQTHSFPSCTCHPKYPSFVNWGVTLLGKWSPILLCCWVTYSPISVFTLRHLLSTVQTNASLENRNAENTARIPSAAVFLFYHLREKKKVGVPSLGGFSTFCVLSKSFFPTSMDQRNPGSGVCSWTIHPHPGLVGQWGQCHASGPQRLYLDWD